LLLTLLADPDPETRLHRMQEVKTLMFFKPIFSLTQTQLLTICNPLSATSGFQLLRCIVNGANFSASRPPTIQLPGSVASQGGNEISSEDVVIITRACLKGLQARF
jgi:hypothetical protein